MGLRFVSGHSEITDLCVPQKAGLLLLDRPSRQPRGQCSVQCPEAAPTQVPAQLRNTV